MFAVCCCNLIKFYDWRECVMSALGTTNIPRAVVLTLGNKVVLYHCIINMMKQVTTEGEDHS